MANTNPFNRLKEFLVDADFIGPKYSFESRRSTRFMSYEGAVISILTVIFLSTIAFMFGKEIYERKLPLVSNSEENISHSTILLKEFPIILYLSNIDGSPLENYESYFEYRIFTTSMNSNNTISIDENSINFTSCDVNRYSKYNNLVEEVLNSSIHKTKDLNFLCLNFDDKTSFTNSYYSKNSTTINFGLRMCNNKRKTCAKDLIQKTSKLVLSVIFVDSFVNAYNYTNPINSYLKLLNYELSNSIFRRSYMRFGNNQLISDNGWIFGDYITQNYPVLQSIVPDDLHFPDSGRDENMMFLMTLESPATRKIIFRSYMKIQDLFAKIGGVINVTLVLVQLCSHHYLRFIYYFYIREKILKINLNPVFEKKDCLSPNKAVEEGIIQLKFSDNKINQTNKMKSSLIIPSQLNKINDDNNKIAQKKEKEKLSKELFDETMEIKNEKIPNCPIIEENINNENSDNKSNKNSVKTFNDKSNIMARYLNNTLNNFKHKVISENDLKFIQNRSNFKSYAELSTSRKRLKENDECEKKNEELNSSTDFRVNTNGTLIENPVHKKTLSEIINETRSEPKILDISNSRDYISKEKENYIMQKSNNIKYSEKAMSLSKASIKPEALHSDFFKNYSLSYCSIEKNYQDKNAELEKNDFYNSNSKFNNKNKEEKNTIDREFRGSYSDYILSKLFCKHEKAKTYDIQIMLVSEIVDYENYLSISLKNLDVRKND